MSSFGVVEFGWATEQEGWAEAKKDCGWNSFGGSRSGW
jgi:hypothetical protein